MLVRNDDLRRTQNYLWFDTDGKEIGKTELTVPREDAGAVSDKDTVAVMPQSLIVMDDGLWVLNDLQDILLFHPLNKLIPISRTRIYE